jgi:Replication-relaxation
MIVQPRDRQFLKELSLLRVVDREQAKIVAGFGSTTRANSRLLKLTRAGLVRRFFLGSGGGRKALYALSEKGSLLADAPMHGPRRPQGAMLIADGFVEHQLAVNSIYCAAKFGKITAFGATFHRWIAFHETIAPELRLIPDGYAEFHSTTGVTAAFLEIDLGTESLAVWREKTRQYLQLALTGTFHRVFGRDRFRVLVIVNSERRLESIRKAIALVTDKIFRFATLDNARKKFLGSIWTKPLSNQSESLFEQLP